MSASSEIALLRERFADVLMEQWPTTIWRRDAALVTADAFLAMPEMQAIKAALVYLSIDLAIKWDTTKEDALRKSSLPEAVVWWVLRRE